MKKIFWAIGLVLSLSLIAFAQGSTTKAAAGGSHGSTIQKDDKTINLASDTQITARLQDSLNVKNAKVGDQVVLKAARSIKQNGTVVVEKGAKIIGRVTDIRKQASADAGSSITVVFSALKQNDMTLPIMASITSVTRAETAMMMDDHSMYGSSSASSSTSASTSTRSSSSGGGLLGGVANTVGGVANTTVSTVGGVANTAEGAVGGLANTTGRAVGGATGAVGSTIHGLSITSSTDASMSGGSTLSMSQGNLKLDKGTMFNLSVSGSAHSETTARTGN